MASPVTVLQPLYLCAFCVGQPARWFYDLRVSEPPNDAQPLADLPLAEATITCSTLFRPLWFVHVLCGSSRNGCFIAALPSSAVPCLCWFLRVTGSSMVSCIPPAICQWSHFWATLFKRSTGSHPRPADNTSVSSMTFTSRSWPWLYPITLSVSLPCQGNCKPVAGVLAEL